MTNFLIMFFLVSGISMEQSLAENCPTKPSLQQASQKIAECIQPTCFSYEGVQDKTKLPEEILKERLKNISPDEAVTRLIFSEMLASQCVDQLADEELLRLSTGIAAVIHHRSLKISSVSDLDSKELAVVFEKGQFRSSTGSCDVAKRAEFLCPSKDPHWQRVWRIAQDSLRKIKQRDPLEAKVIYYYFPKHYAGSKTCEKFNSPEVFGAWKKGKVEVEIPGANQNLKECVRFFK